MMRAAVRVSVLVAGAVAAGLLTSGCKTSGSGGGFSSFGSSFSGSGSEVILSTGGGQVADFEISPATVAHPEPASVALFGGGLVGLAAWRRRKSRATS